VPSYEQRAFAPAELDNVWCLVASGQPRDGAVTVHQDVHLSISRLAAGRSLSYAPKAGRRVWLQVARGSVEVAGVVLEAGDAAGWVDAAALDVRAVSAAEILLFDLS